MTTPKHTLHPTENGVLVIFEEPQPCAKCKRASCVWMNRSDGVVSCYCCSVTLPPSAGETTGTVAT